MAQYRFTRSHESDRPSGGLWAAQTRARLPWLIPYLLVAAVSAIAAIGPERSKGAEGQNALHAAAAPSPASACDGAMMTPGGDPYVFLVFSREDALSRAPLC